MHTSFKTRQKAGCASTRHHVSYISRPCLPASVGSGVAMCLTTPDPTSLLERAPVLPCVLQLWVSLLDRGGLRRCHVPCGSWPCLLSGEGSGTTMCPMAPDIASPMERLRRCHTSHGSLWATDHKHKETLSWHGYAARSACFQSTRACFQDDWH
jgi:hypothetical protein